MRWLGGLVAVLMLLVIAGWFFRADLLRTVPGMIQRWRNPRFRSRTPTPSPGRASSLMNLQL